MNNFKKMEEYNYEQLVYFYDETTGLKGITCIHNTVLGPALGGTRLWNYDNEEAAVTDVMRLARGMTLKNAAAGLNLGGGKTVLIGDADQIKSEAYFRALGRYVNSLNGRYITAEDVNTTTKDMEYVNMETNHVVGLEGKSGNPSPFTALGAFYGVKASLKVAYNTEDFSKFSFAVQGAGQTGQHFIAHLLEAKAKKIYYTEINPNKIAWMKEHYPQVEFVHPEHYFNLDVDVLCPCALGGILNDQTIPTIKAKVIAGTANNVLENEDRHGQMLLEKGIVYAPDFVINAGGVINVYHEILGYNKENATREVKKIYDRLLTIFEMAQKMQVTTQQAAKIFAQERIDTIAKIQRNYMPK